jgi:hypothetical protein
VSLGGNFISDAKRACRCSSLLVLDAVTGGDLARLYERLGWERVGVIPGYALLPKGRLCDTTVCYRNLGDSLQHHMGRPG